MNDESEDPLAGAAKAPALMRFAGAALFIIAAIAGISTIRACRELPRENSPPAVPSSMEAQ